MAEQASSDWIKWDGIGRSPVAPGTMIEVRYRGAADPAKGTRFPTTLPAWAFAWWHDGQDDDVVAYRAVSA